MTELKSKTIIKSYPCFSSLTEQQVSELIALMHEQVFLPKDLIVKEHELVDKIYFIWEGGAEVVHETLKRNKVIATPLAVLGEGDSIGLDDRGFYSGTGKRTATVYAIDHVKVLCLDIKTLNQFLKKYHLDSSMLFASEEMIRMNFIKQSLPFSRLSHERLKELAGKIDEKKLSAGEILFKEGDPGDASYLIRSGEIAINAKDKDGVERQLTVLKSPALFGEATLITSQKRNATATAKTEAQLYVLEHKLLSEILESEENVANTFMELMVDRSRPAKNPDVSIHERMTKEGEKLIILKNPRNNHYFRLSNEGYFIWKQLNGENTVQDITLNLATEYDIFSPDVVSAIISKLIKSGFVENIEIGDSTATEKQPLWVRLLIFVRRMLDKRIAIGNVDQRLSSIHKHYTHYLFTKAGQFVLALLIISGFICFLVNTSDMLNFFIEKPVSLALILMLIPLSLLGVVAHELGHAFAVKACGREVHYLGLGWTIAGPTAFTDTSDMWLATRKPRTIVNFAGVYTDILFAGMVSLTILLITNPYLQSILWLYALYAYISAFRMLSPLNEWDGYYVLMDWLDKPRLRESAVLWLLHGFPKTLKNPGLLLEHKAEVIYWLACLVYLIFISILTLFIQKFVFAIIGIESNPYVSLIIPFLVVIFSSLSVIAEIKHRTS